jgi:hypothetical protein
VNASSVEPNLGSKNYGYLGLVITNEECTNMPNAESFIVPIYLDQLKIPVTAIPIEVL